MYTPVRGVEYNNNNNNNNNNRQHNLETQSHCCLSMTHTYFLYFMITSWNVDNYGNWYHPTAPLASGVGTMGVPGAGTPL